MKLTDSRDIAAPPDLVWTAILDPEVLRECIPGCQSLEKVADDRFTATVEVKVGPIGARFKGAVSLADLDPPYGYTLITIANLTYFRLTKQFAVVRFVQVLISLLLPFFFQWSAR